MIRFIAVAALLLPAALLTPQAKAQYYNPYAQQYQQWNRDNGYGSSRNNEMNPYNQMNQQYRQNTYGNQLYSQPRQNSWY